MNVFKKIFTLSKSALIYAYYNLVFIKKEFKVKEGKYAIVNIDEQLKDDDLCRYFYMICFYLDNSGFKVIIKTHWRDFKTFKKPFDFKRLLLKHNYIFVRSCSAALNTIELVQSNTTNHIIHLSYGYNIIQAGHFNCIVNYPMYPLQYKFHSDKTTRAELGKSRRAIKVFFAGDTNKIKYGNDQIKKFFDVMPRLEVIDFILLNFEKSRKLQGHSGETELKKLLASQDYGNEIIISEVKTSEKDWLKILSKTDFFICPPGVRIPWSHNCVEAMAVGAIPILEYGDLFYPHLEDMKNCLSYTNSIELKIVIEKALAMEPLQIESMRNDVLAYYEDHLSLNSMSKKIKEFAGSSQTELKVAIPFIPTKEQWRAQISLYDPRFLKQIGLLRFHSARALKV